MFLHFAFSGTSHILYGPGQMNIRRMLPCNGFYISDFMFFQNLHFIFLVLTTEFICFYISLFSSKTFFICQVNVNVKNRCSE